MTISVTGPDWGYHRRMAMERELQRRNNMGSIPLPGAAPPSTTVSGKLTVRGGEVRFSGYPIPATGTTPALTRELARAGGTAAVKLTPLGRLQGDRAPTHTQLIVQLQNLSYSVEIL